MTEYLIRLPWPPKKTSKNGSQGDYLGKARAAKSYKNTCAKICWEQSIRSMGDVVVEVIVIFCPPPRVNSYDLDNTLARCKQGMDAVAEAIGIDDGKWQRQVLERGSKTKDGAVLVHVKPMVEIPLRGVIT